MNQGLASSMEKYFDRLWPICRSIAGPGYRQSLDILSEVLPVERLKFPTGQKAFDWIVPKEWSVCDAYFVDPAGKKHRGTPVPRWPESIISPFSLSYGNSN